MGTKQCFNQLNDPWPVTSQLRDVDTMYFNDKRYGDTVLKTIAF